MSLHYASRLSVTTINAMTKKFNIGRKGFTSVYRIVHQRKKPRQKSRQELDTEARGQLTGLLS